MRNDSDRLQWQTEKNYIMNTFHNGLRRIQTDSKTAQQYVLLCLALAVAAPDYGFGRLWRGRDFGSI